MRKELLQSYDKVRGLKRQISKIEKEFIEEMTSLEYQVGELIEIIHYVETKCLSSNRQIDGKGFPIHYRHYQRPSIISIRNKGQLIKIRYSYDYHDCVKYGTLKIPHSYLSMTDDQIRTAHTEWTLNKIATTNQEILRKNQEQHDKWVKDAKEAEYKRYLELKKKYEDS